MLMYYVTEEKFLKGVTIYLKNRLYANSVTKDLWQGIAEASGKYTINPYFAGPLHNSRLQVSMYLRSWIIG